MAKNISQDILIDYGHAKANHWNLEKLLSNLSGKIKSYHLHTNDGLDDLHLSFYKNYDELDDFLALYKKYTPKAYLVIE